MHTYKSTQHTHTRAHAIHAHIHSRNIHRIHCNTRMQSQNTCTCIHHIHTHSIQMHIHIAHKCTHNTHIYTQHTQEHSHSTHRHTQHTHTVQAHTETHTCTQACCRPTQAHVYTFAGLHRCAWAVHGCGHTSGGWPATSQRPEDLARHEACGREWAGNDRLSLPRDQAPRGTSALLGPRASLCPSFPCSVQPQAILRSLFPPRGLQLSNHL